MSYFTFDELTPNAEGQWLEQSLNNWLLCEITTGRIRHAREITIARNDMQSGRLRANSRVRPDRMATLNESVFGNYIGRLTDAKLAEILAAVRALF